MRLLLQISRPFMVVVFVLLAVLFSMSRGDTLVSSHNIERRGTDLTSQPSKATSEAPPYWQRDDDSNNLGIPGLPPASIINIPPLIPPPLVTSIAPAASSLAQTPSTTLTTRVVQNPPNNGGGNPLGGLGSLLSIFAGPLTSILPTAAVPSVPALSNLPVGSLPSLPLVIPSLTLPGPASVIASLIPAAITSLDIPPGIPGLTVTALVPTLSDLPGIPTIIPELPNPIPLLTLSPDGFQTLTLAGAGLTVGVPLPVSIPGAIPTILNGVPLGEVGQLTNLAGVLSSILGDAGGLVGTITSEIMSVLTPIVPLGDVTSWLGQATAAIGPAWCTVEAQVGGGVGPFSVPCPAATTPSSPQSQSLPPLPITSTSSISLPLPASSPQSQSLPPLPITSTSSISLPLPASSLLGPSLPSSPMASASPASMSIATTTASISSGLSSTSMSSVRSTLTVTLGASLSTISASSSLTSVGSSSDAVPSAATASLSKPLLTIAPMQSSVLTVLEITTVTEVITIVQTEVTSVTTCPSPPITCPAVLPCPLCPPQETGICNCPEIPAPTPAPPPTESLGCPCPGQGYTCDDCPDRWFCPPPQTPALSAPCGYGWPCYHCLSSWFCIPSPTFANTLTVTNCPIVDASHSPRISSGYGGGSQPIPLSSLPGGSFPSALPMSNPPASGWQYAGCYKNDASQALKGATLSSSASPFGMSNEACVTFCRDAGYIVAGTNSGSTCYCGNELVDSYPLDDAACNIKCSGGSGSATVCGGPEALSVYSPSGNVVLAVGPEQSFPRPFPEPPAGVTATSFHSGGVMQTVLSITTPVFEWPPPISAVTWTPSPSGGRSPSLGAGPEASDDCKTSTVGTPVSVVVGAAAQSSLLHVDMADIAATVQAIVAAAMSEASAIAAVELAKATRVVGSARVVVSQGLGAMAGQLSSVAMAARAGADSGLEETSSGDDIAPEMAAITSATILSSLSLAAHMPRQQHLAKPTSAQRDDVEDVRVVPVGTQDKRHRRRRLGSG